MTDQLVTAVERSLMQTQLGISKLEKSIFFLNGMSSPKVRHFLNNLCELPDTRYLEIGSWRGSTIISALYHNHTTVSEAIGIDNFSEFHSTHANGLIFNVNPLINMLDADGQRFFLSAASPKEELIEKSDFFLPTKPQRFNFYDDDCFSDTILHQLKTAHSQTRINTYFYDGGHDRQSQFKAFTEYDFILDDEFIAIVDDWNAEGVKEGTFEAFTSLGYRVVKEWELPANSNGDIYNWWNGLYVAVIEKNRWN
jgi:hypothetical protein